MPYLVVRGLIRTDRMEADDCCKQALAALFVRCKWLALDIFALTSDRETENESTSVGKENMRQMQSDSPQRPNRSHLRKP